MKNFQYIITISTLIKDFGFDWENKNLTYKFTITLSKDEKKLTKK